MFCVRRAASIFPPARGKATLSIVLLVEPLAAVGDPPTSKDDWNGREERPPDGKGEIGHDSQERHGDPENFALHGLILVPSAKRNIITLVSGGRAAPSRLRQFRFRSC